MLLSMGWFHKSRLGPANATLSTLSCALPASPSHLSRGVCTVYDTATSTTTSRESARRRGRGDRTRLATTTGVCVCVCVRVSVCVCVCTRGFARRAHLHRPGRLGPSARLKSECALVGFHGGGPMVVVERRWRRESWRRELEVVVTVVCWRWWQLRRSCVCVCVCCWFGSSPRGWWGF